MKNAEEFNRVVISEVCEIIEVTRALKSIGSVLNRDREDDSGWRLEPEDRAGLELAVGPLSSFAQTVAVRILDHLDDLGEPGIQPAQEINSALEFGACVRREPK